MASLARPSAVTTIYSGLATGGLYALVAIAYNIVFVATGVFNFAQAQFLMLGCFLTYVGYRDLHWPLLIVVPAGLAAGAAIGILEERVAVRYVRPGIHAELITTLGVSVFMAGAAAAAFGSDPKPVPFFGNDSVLTLFGGRVSVDEITIVLCAVAAAALAELLFGRTILGLQWLAGAEDRVAATLKGIRVPFIATLAFVIAGAYCFVLGPIVAPKTFAVFDLGDTLTLKAFVALAIGGFGSNTGALIGGLVAGLVEAGGARYIGSDYQDVMMFGLLLVVLLTRPTGLLGRPLSRTV